MGTALRRSCQTAHNATGDRPCISALPCFSPSTGRPGQDGDAFDTVPKFREMVKQAGRDPESCPVSIFGPGEDGDTLKRYRDLGIARAAVILPAASEDVVLPILDRWVGLICQTAR